MDILDDSSEFIKLDNEEIEFMSVWKEPPIASSWTNFPKKYKFTGIELLFDNNVNLVSRETYGFLEFLGDLGGLYDALRIIFGILLAPISSFSLMTNLMINLFRR